MGVKDWADLDDNRVGPILQDLADAIEQTDDPVMLARISSRLKFMSSSVRSLKNLRELEQRGW